MLNRHNVIEHDGSLSRRDMYFDPSNRFDKPTFDAFIAYFGDATTISTADMANARARHALAMSRINPTFTLPESSVPLFLGEASLMLALWGSPSKPVANRAFLEYFFRKTYLYPQLWKDSFVFQVLRLNRKREITCTDRLGSERYPHHLSHHFANRKRHRQADTFRCSFDLFSTAFLRMYHKKRLMA